MILDRSPVCAAAMPPVMCFRTSASGRCRRDRRRDRPQRRRQEHADARRSSVFCRARSGTIGYQGNDISACVPRTGARGIGYVPQGRGMFGAMSVLDNLRMGCFIGRSHQVRIRPESIAYFPFPARAGRQLSRHAQRRPAGDAGDRACTGRRAAVAAARRAERRRAAEYRARDRRFHPTSNPGRPMVCSSWNRTWS